MKPLSFVGGIDSGAWAMEPTRLSALAQRLAAIPAAELARTRAETNEGPPHRAPYTMHGSTAEIRIYGVLMKSVPWIYEAFGIDCTATGSLRSSIERAVKDPGVKAIALRIDSPGGQVAGVLEAGDAIHAAAQEKPVNAFVEGMAASGAYWLASQSTEISATEDSYVGSIGVYQVWEDDSAAAEKAGVKVHVIRSGEHKGMGVAGAPITDEQIKATQELVDGLCSIFKGAVQRGRNDDDADDLDDDDMDALATGQVWLAKDAKKQGLVDRIEPAGAGFTRMLAEVEMADKKDEDEKAKAKAEAQAQVLAAVALDRKRFTDLKAAFPEDLGFATEQYEAGATVETASVSYVGVLRAKMAAVTSATAAVRPAGPAGAPPLRSSGDPAAASQGGDFLARARALAAEKKTTIAAAMSSLARQNPKAHRSFIEGRQKPLQTLKKELANALEHGPAQPEAR